MSLMVQKTKADALCVINLDFMTLNVSAHSGSQQLMAAHSGSGSQTTEFRNLQTLQTLTRDMFMQLEVVKQRRELQLKKTRSFEAC